MNVKEIAPLPRRRGTEMRADSPATRITKGFSPLFSDSTACNPITPPAGEF